MIFLPEPPHAPPEKILFLKLEEQGALVLANAAVQRAATLVGRSNVYFCVFAENRALLEELSLVPNSNIFTIRTQHPIQIAADTLLALVRIRRTCIDTVVDLEFFARGSAILAFLTGARNRVGLHSFNSETSYRGNLHTHRVASNPYLHTAMAYDVLVRALTVAPEQVPLLKEPLPDVELPAPVFKPSTAGLAAARARGRIIDQTGPLIIIHPNCIDALRVRSWPPERYAALCRRALDAHPDARIILTGLESERTQIEGLVESVGNQQVTSLAGELSIHEFLCLLTLADVLITNDSGPAHFAALTPVHQVVIYGPETPAVFGPLGPRKRVLYRQFACSPCLTIHNYRNSPCRDNRCVQDISVEEVAAAVEECLTERVGVPC
jgi:ADP-heptose:LPS heptosyltransferase